MWIITIIVSEIFNAALFLQTVIKKEKNNVLLKQTMGDFQGAMGDFQGAMGDYGFVRDSFGNGSGGNFNGVNPPQIPPGPPLQQQHMVNGKFFILTICIIRTLLI